MKTKRPQVESVENFNRYRFYAERAAKAEQTGDYKDAIVHWQLASLSANEPTKYGQKTAKTSANE